MRASRGFRVPAGGASAAGCFAGSSVVVVVVVAVVAAAAVEEDEGCCGSASAPAAVAAAVVALPFVSAIDCVCFVGLNGAGWMDSMVVRARVVRGVGGWEAVTCSGLGGPGFGFAGREAARLIIGRGDAAGRPIIGRIAVR